MKVKLLKPHTHAGIEYLAGEIVEIEDEKRADWLIGTGVAEAVYEDNEKGSTGMLFLRSRQE